MSRLEQKLNNPTVVLVVGVVAVAINVLLYFGYYRAQDDAAYRSDKPRWHLPSGGHK
jgi:hypothetical protein